MTSRATGNDKPRAAYKPEAQGPAAARYVSELKASYGRHVRPANEARRIVDESMGAAETLTGLLSYYSVQRTLRRQAAIVARECGQPRSRARRL